MKQSFCFILTPLDFEGNLPCEIIPGHFFQRANQEQVKIIKEKLSPYLEPFCVPQYEFHNPPMFNSTAERGEQPLPENLWRYWVINFEESNREIPELGYATSLLKNEIELGFSFLVLHGGTGFSWNSEFLSSFFKPINIRDKVIEVKTDNLKEASDNYAAVKLAHKNHPDIYKAIHRFHYLKALPRHSSMLVIGYFSIIEALIAHKPRLQESLDSINHQLRSKLILLAKKFQRRLDYSVHFGKMNEKEIWKQLYAYRSAITHDMLVNFDSEFKNLGGQANVLSFLSEVVKLLLLFALKEPVFLADLKSC